MTDDLIAIDNPVNWSSDLTALADSLLEQLRQTNQMGHDPFEKNCIVVNSPATEKWLKQYFLLDRKDPQVLFNLDFITLPEFVNDWLWTAISGKPPRERQASRHPYSREMLSWRIFRILRDASPDGVFSELLDYIGNKENSALKRRGLSEKLAVLYDDYLNSRFQMLRRWEKGDTAGCDVPDWQIELYRELVRENSGTYAAEYEKALKEKTAADAVRYGFPQYSSVHIFDIPFIPEPHLRLLEKISETLPMKFWNFNPTGDWLAETLSFGEAARRLRKDIEKILKNHRDALKNGGQPPDCIEMLYESPEERLLGALAPGGRGVISALCSDFEGNVNVLPQPSEPDAFGLKNVSIAVHSVYSPRRELEAVKDGLHEFFRTHPDAAPHEALVLCADWETYAPVIDMVFPPLTGKNVPPPGYIPITTESIPGNSQIVQSFEDLLKFRSNRFEVSEVFSLLNVAGIRSRRGLDENAVDILRQMVQTANIHWGLDDKDVNKILNFTDETGENSKNPFTWQRGFDRFMVEFLHGFDADDLLKNAGDAIGELHPCGHVEGERAVYIAALWSLVKDLEKLRMEKLPKGETRTVGEILDSLLWSIDTFYDESGDKFKELNEIRRTIKETARNMESAGLTEIEVEVFIQAVFDAINKPGPGRKNSADSVLFTPLNCYTATPRKFIWICGLNDGVFPRMDCRSADDAIGRHPSLFDTSLREQDSFALLKATLCARMQLSYSYVGKDIHTKESVPSAVLLDDLTDYFKAADIKFVRYEHPLQGYSRLCFQGDGKLPPAYSGIHRQVAQCLESKNNGSLTAFPLAESGVTEIDLEDLTAFFSAPHKYLFGKLNASIPRFNQADDSECIEPKIDKKLKRKLALEEMSDAQRIQEAQLSVESGNAPNAAAAFREINDLSENLRRPIEFKKNRTVVYSCLDDNDQPLNLAETYLAQNQEEDKEIELSVRGKPVRIRLKCRTIRLKVLDEGQEKGYEHSILFFDNLYEPTKNVIRLRHLAVNAALNGNTATIAFCPDSKTGCRPISEEIARDRLQALLELAAGPLPAGYPDLGKSYFRKSDFRQNPFGKDTLPEDWQKVLSNAVAFI